MKTTLFIEISEITARILVFNEVDGLCHYIDVTGGYGKKSIPLHIHYLSDGEILIGEDALLYDQEETSRYIDSILYGSDVNRIDFIKTLIHKVKELIPELHIKHMVIVSDHSSVKSEVFKLNVLKSIKHISLKILSVEEAMAGWYHDQQQLKVHQNEEFNNQVTALYLDYKNIKVYRLKPYLKDNKIQITKDKSALDLNAIHDFYINLLSHLHDKDEGVCSSHQISQLYNSQKATLHKQLLVNKDVNVYSSVFFPPKKLVINYSTFQEFKNRWYEQLKVEGGISLLKNLESVDKVISTGGYDLINFLTSFDDFGFQTNYFEEYLLLDGAFHYYKALLKGQDLIYNECLDYSIGVFNNQEFFPLIQENEEFKESYELEVILSEYQKEIQFFSKVNETIKLVYTLEIEEILKLQKVLLKIKINHDKEIEEVSYELRRL